MPIGNISISAAIITFNEERNINDCLDSLSWVDEIIVIDSLSTDRTKEIALKAGAIVVDQKFLGHVKQKQLALDNCSNEWVISLDADERVSLDLKKEIKKLFENTKEEELKSAYQVSRRSFNLGRWIMHGGWYPDRKVRIVQKSKAKWAGVDPHDSLESEEKAGRLKSHLDHYVFKDLSHNVKQNDFFSSISAKILFEEGKKPSLIKLIFKPLGKFIETYIVKKGFLDGLPGFIISIGAAYSLFLKYAKLWEHHLPNNSIEQDKQ